jgi:hypothetical protein
MLDLLDMIAARDAALKQVAANAGENFRCRALRFVVAYLREHGERSGEEVTDAVWNAGIEAHDRRAMGPVFVALLRDGLIERCGTCIRKRGHGTAGGSVYRLKA